MTRSPRQEVALMLRRGSWDVEDKEDAHCSGCNIGWEDGDFFKLIERGSFVTAQSLRIVYCWKAPLLGFFDAKTSAKPVTLSPFLKWVTPEPTASTVPAMSLPRMVGYDSMK